MGVIGFVVKYRKLLGAAIVFGLLVALTLMLRAARAEAYGNALAAANARADADTTRKLLVDEDGITWELRARQAELQRNVLDEKLRTRPVVEIPVSVRVDTIRIVGQAPVVEEEGVRSAHFEEYREPVRLTADVELPAPPAQGRLTFSVALDPLTLTTRVSCSEDEVSGVRSAFVRVQGPPWASVAIGAATQDPDVCSPRPRGLGFSFGRDLVSPVLLGAGEGALIVWISNGDAGVREYALGAGTGAAARLLEKLLFR